MLGLGLAIGQLGLQEAPTDRWWKLSGLICLKLRVMDKSNLSMNEGGSENAETRGKCKRLKRHILGFT